VVPSPRPHFFFESWSLLEAFPPPAALEALLSCQGSREIYLREIVCEYVVL
jgi:hypothetical protein